MPSTANAATFTAMGSGLVKLIEDNPDLLPILDYAAGALLSLIEAERYGFQERAGACGPNYQELVVAAVKEMPIGKIPDANFWVAGWHFNSALIRIAASYKRVNGVFTRAARQQVPKGAVIGHRHVMLDKIVDEVDSLKHDQNANHPGRDVKFDEALEGLEELIDFIAKSRP